MSVKVQNTLHLLPIFLFKMEENSIYHYDGERDSIYSRIQKYIENKYSLRFNTVDQECYISSKITPGKNKPLNINSLCLELADAKLNISLNNLRMYLNSDRVERFNPIREYFTGLPEWDGKDHIGRLCSYVPTKEPEDFQNQMEKWFVRTILCAFEEDKVNKHCIVLFNTIQSSGKTTFLRFLNPPVLKDYYTEQIGTDKDSRIKLTKNLIINLDELSVLGKGNINSLKSLISAASITDRLPYAAKQERIKRICSFIGSTNMTEFLTDGTGNVRWIVFEVSDRINFDFKNEVDINKVWAQAYHIAYKEPGYNPELSIDDLKKNEDRNEKYRVMTIEEEVINQYFEKSTDSKDFMNATDVMQNLEEMNVRLSYKLNHHNIGRALKSIGFERLKCSQRQVYGYLIKLRNS